MLITAGAQVPVTPFVEVVGKGGVLPPLQIDVGKLKVGVMEFVTVTVNVKVVPHWPALGVNT